MDNEENLEPEESPDCLDHLVQLVRLAREVNRELKVKLDWQDLQDPQDLEVNPEIEDRTARQDSQVTMNTFTFVMIYHSAYFYLKQL